MSDPVPAFAVDPATRTALHAVAEHVLAAARHRATGRIGLRLVPGGFGTPPFPVDGAGERTVDVVTSPTGVELVVRDDAGERRAPLTTLAAAADLAGLDGPGGPAEVYTLQTALEPDAPLTVHPVRAVQLTEWFATVAAALDGLAADVRAEGGSVDPPTLWPEHFDLGTSVDEVNFGASPGDGFLGAPYAYVGPWTPRTGEFWDAPFGAARPAAEVPSVGAVLDFFRTGRSLARLG